MKCRVCGNDKNNIKYEAKEMMMGFRDTFDYFECSKCGCLQICEIPTDLDKYYPSNYLPHAQRETFTSKLYDILIIYIIFRRSLLGFLLYYFVNFDENEVILYELLNTYRKNNLLKKESKILDVGCADGKFLSYLYRGGCRNLTGIDLFIDESKFKDKLNLIQVALDEYDTDEQYDFIFSNHSFEHMENPLINLKCFKNLLKDNGYLFLSMPVKSKLIWEEYGINW